jgi:hypothetical protein
MEPGSLRSETWYSLELRPARLSFDSRYRLALRRRRKARRFGQLWLTPEIEYAPLAPQEIPGPVYDRLIQTDFFRQGV